MINKIVDILKGKNLAILGFGREGKTTYQFIRKYLSDVMITIIDIDDVSDDKLLAKDNNIQFVYGKNYLDNLEQYDLVIKSPGISLKDIDTSNINITSQIELLLRVNKKNIIGVTGTKGKTTTSSLIHSILLENGIDAVLAGNIGTPVFSLLDDIKDSTIMVIEMSSHQLEFLKISPHIGVVLNLFEDHLDHDGSLTRYYENKMHIFSKQTDDDYMIYCQDNERLNEWIKLHEYKGKKYTIDMTGDSATVCLKNDNIYYNDSVAFPVNIKRKLLGLHNLENILAAYTVSKILNLDDEKTLRAIQNFNPVAYRLELIGTVNGVDYYVDTLATIPQATINAIKSIDNINTLIFGGMDRGISYDGFAEFLTSTNIEHFICMPMTGHIIAKDLPKEKVYIVETLEEACKIAKKLTKKHTACILSPAAASYNQFKSYAEKGDKFKEYILK